MSAVRVYTSSGWQDVAVTGPPGPAGVGAGGAGLPAQGGSADWSYLITQFGGAVWQQRGVFIPMNVFAPGPITNGMIVPPGIVPQGIKSAGQGTRAWVYVHLLFLSGTGSFGYQPTLNGTPFGSISYSPSAPNTVYSTSFNQSVNNLDRLGIAISAVSGSPANLSIMYTLDQML